MYCYSCGIRLEVERKIRREQICPECGVSLHCCRNCVFYKETAYHQCRETQAEFVNDKGGSNFCSYFIPLEEKKDKDDDKAAQARKRLDKLFGEKSEKNNEN